MFNLFKCKHKWVLAIPEKDVKIGGNVPYVCSKCGEKYVATPQRILDDHRYFKKCQDSY